MSRKQKSGATQNKQANKVNQPTPAVTIAAKPVEKPLKKLADKPVEKPAEKPVDTVQKPTPQINLASVEATEHLNQSNGSSSVTADTMTRLGCLLQERYVNGNNLGKQYPVEFINTMNNYVDVCAIGAIVLATEEARARGGSLKLLFPEDKLPAITAAANSVGIALPTTKMIETTESSKTKAGKQLEIDFTQAKVPENISIAAKKEIESRTKKIETDPEKIASLEDLYAAGDFVLSDNNRGSFAKRIADAVDLYKAYHIIQCGEDTAKKSNIEDKQINEWIEEISHTTSSNVLIKCLGAGMYSSVATTKCPMGAFLLLRKNLMDENKTPIWTDESIALAVKSLVEMTAKDRIKTMVDAKGNPKENAITSLKDDKTLTYLTNFSEDVINMIMSPEEREKDSGIKSIYGLALANYFVDKTSKNVTDDMKNMIANKIGAVANMFRPFDAKLNNYPSSTEAKDFPPAPAEEPKKPEVEEKKTASTSK